MRVAFIGVGHMGLPMCANLLKAGHAVTAWDLVPAHLVKAVAAGAAGATSVADCVAQAEAVVSMLPSSPHVRSV